MARIVKISACQFGLRKYLSFTQFTDHLEQIFDQVPDDSDYVLFPELITSGLLSCFPGSEHFSAVDFPRITEYTGQFTEYFQGKALSRGQIILAGSHLENREGAYYNVGYIFKEDGNFIRQDKTHLIPAETKYRTNEGSSINVYDIGPARIGLAICYEAEFPEISRIMSKAGAEIIFCPSHTSSEHGFWRVRHCAQARAIENQVYYVHSPLVGDACPPIPSGFGRASVLSPCDTAWNPDGVVSEGINNREMVVTGEVNIDALYENRRNGAAPTFYDHERRVSLYRKYKPFTIN